MVAAAWLQRQKQYSGARVPLETPPQDMKTGYGPRIRSARKNANLTQRELLRACGWDDTHAARISQYESEKREPTLSDLARIAEATGCDPAMLAFGTVDVDPAVAKLILAHRLGSPDQRETLVYLAERILGSARSGRSRSKTPARQPRTARKR